MPTGRDAQWFSTNRGLRNEGLDATLLTNTHVAVEEIDEFFGPKHGKNGWRYNKRPDPKTVQWIEALYQRVTGLPKVTNKQLTLTFARAIIADRKPGMKVNWAAFAAYTCRFREEVRATKAASLERRATEEELVQDGRVGLLAVKQEFATREQTTSASPPQLKISTSVNKNMAGSIVASAFRKWEDVDVDRVSMVLSTRIVAHEVAQSVLDADNVYREEVLGDLRRMRMELADRQLMHAQKTVNVERADAMLEVAKTYLAERELEFRNANPRVSPISDVLDIVVIPNLDVGTTSWVEFVQGAQDRVNVCEGKKRIEVEAEQLAKERIGEAEVECQHLSVKAENARSSFVDKKQQIAKLQVEISGLKLQVLRMKEGRGAITWPTPISSPSGAPSKWVCLLNACPLCGLWYDCNDHMFAPCGHCYHPWCMSTHATMSNTCLVADCETKFSIAWCAAWGLPLSDPSAPEPSNNQRVSRPPKSKATKIECKLSYTIPCFIHVIKWSCKLQAYGDTTKG